MASSERTTKKKTKDPRGGLTAAGRKAFKKKEGANLRPGVTKPESEMTPEDMRRKGSFLRRHFANPRGPVKDDDGELTRLALSAHAWGERVPKTISDTKKLAAKGTRLSLRNLRIVFNLLAASFVIGPHRNLALSLRR